MTLNPALIKSRIKNFWGYGNLSSDFWFVGMEEGFSGSKADLQLRFKATVKKSTVDLRNGMVGVKDHLKWFKPKAPIQPTWGKLIYLLLYFRTRIEPTKEEIRNFQIEEFCSSNSDHVNIELMPLPCKSVNEKDWIYQNPHIPRLSTRKLYIENYKKIRVQNLRSLINKYRPKIVIFYSMSYLQDWRSIIPGELSRKSPELLAYAGSKTTYIVIPHPASRGMSKKNWKNIGELILRI